MLRFLHRLAVLRFIGIFPPMGVTDKKAKNIRGLFFLQRDLFTTQRNSYDSAGALLPLTKAVAFLDLPTPH